MGGTQARVEHMPLLSERMTAGATFSAESRQPRLDEMSSFKLVRVWGAAYNTI